MTLPTAGDGESSGYAVLRGEGQGIWFLGTLMVVKAGAAQTHGGLSIIEAHLPPGFAPPPHVHHREDEGFYLLDGAMDVTCGDSTWTVGPGDFALLPREVPHTFTVSPEQPATMLQLSWPGQFEQFAAEVGEPAARMTLPEPAEPDLDRLFAAAERYRITLLPPAN